MSDQDLVERYADGYRRLNEAIQGLSEELLHFRPAPNTWTIREIVVHVADAEVVGIHRMKAVLSETNPLLLAFDQERWTSNGYYDRIDHLAALQSFRLLRECFVPVLRSLAAEDWERTGVHNQAGILTLRQLVESFAAHAEGHVAQINRNKQAYG